MVRLGYWQIWTEPERAQAWCERVWQQPPLFACALGFTETALVPDISAAGATPQARRYTALADAEILHRGFSARLPTAPAGYPSPVVISRALCESLGLRLRLINCGLPESLPYLESVGGLPARCVSTGAALPIAIVEALWQAGLRWGQQQQAAYVVLGECVAGGTTTALAVLLGLGLAAAGMVNSSHPVGNHAQKLVLVQQGLRALRPRASAFKILAAVGDPMQPFVAGAALALSQTRPVMLAGGSQMLAIYALMQRLATETQTPWQPDQVVVGTTRWVAADPTANTVGLAQLVGTVPLLSTSLSFRYARYPQLAAYEQGHVKEGVGAGGLAISASLYRQWGQAELLSAIEATYARVLTQP